MVIEGLGGFIMHEYYSNKMLYYSALQMNLGAALCIRREERLSI